MIFTLAAKQNYTFYVCVFKLNLINKRLKRLISYFWTRNNLLQYIIYSEQFKIKMFFNFVFFSTYQELIIIILCHEIKKSESIEKAWLKDGGYNNGRGRGKKPGEMR